MFEGLRSRWSTPRACAASTASATAARMAAASRGGSGPASRRRESVVPSTYCIE